MKISKGPMLEKFATLIDADISEVIEWTNNYVNCPGELPMQEATEKERFESIKRYIQFRLDNSLTQSIKNDIAAKQLKAA